MATKKVDPKVTRDSTQKMVGHKAQETTLVLPNRLEYILEKKIWKDLERADGERFTSFSEFLTDNQPYGLGIGQYNHFFNLDQLQAICKNRRALSSALAQARPNNRGKRNDLVYNVNQVNDKAKKGNSREYLLRRLEKEAPEIHERWIAGEFKSVRAAAIAAGIIKDDSHNALRWLKSNWKKATKKQRDEFRKWLRTKEAK